MGWESELLRDAPRGLSAAVRIGAVLAVAPPFAHVAVPRRVRALLAMALAIGIAPTLPVDVAMPSSWGQLALSLTGEALIGLAMGLGIAMVFAGATWAGGLVANQMGLELAGSYDPAADNAQATLGQAYWLLAVVVFMACDGHLLLVRGLRSSFDAVPVMSMTHMQHIVPMMTGIMQSTTALALHLAAPVMLATLAADLAMGMIGRTIPQVGLMTAAVTIRAAAALIVLMVTCAATAMVLQGATVKAMSQIWRI